MPRKLLTIVLVLLSAPALGALEGPGREQYLHAVRTTSDIRVDGRLDEEAWRQAEVFDGFVQVYPRENTPPSERTEVRVLYDDRNVYIGFHMHDSQPEQINRQLGRRDRPPTSDSVRVAIDSAHDHRTAYVFEITAGGVLHDGLLFQDGNFTGDWDAVWDGAAALTPDGWSAEMVIPLQILRYPEAAVQTWGFGVHRHIFRLHEDDLSVYVPLNVLGQVSRLGHLTGMELRPLRELELLPYMATRSVLRPQFSDAIRTEPRLLEPSLDIGLDLKTALSSELTLNATVNPDFGQVEADQVVLNLSGFEQFYPEKRPFFTQGMDIFQPVGVQANGLAPQMLFYSRRIGLRTPILAAAKLTGTVGRSIDVGLLDAFVAEAAAPDQDEARPDRRWQLHPMRPLHLGPNHALPTRASVPQNFFVGVARGRGGNSTVGVRATSAIPLGNRCTEADAALDEALRPPACAARAGNAAAIDWDLRTANGEWATQGQFEGSQVVGGPPSRTLRDGTVLRRGATGLGGYVKTGKLGGEPFRFDVGYQYASPTLDLDATGYLRTQNAQSASAGLHYLRPSGLGWLHSFNASLLAEAIWTTDGRRLPRSKMLLGNLQATLPGFHSLGLEGQVLFDIVDVREIVGTGIAFERPPGSYIALFGNSDPRRRLAMSGFVAVGFHPLFDGSTALGYGSILNFTLRPGDRLETKLSVGLDRSIHGPRYLTRDDAVEDRYLFGDLHSEFASVTLRQQLVLTPRLTLQAYAQLFTDFGLYGPFYEGRPGGGVIRLAELSATEYAGRPSFHDAVLNMNVVLRWEYGLGSTVYLVYTHSQKEPPYASGVLPPASLLPGNLFRGPAVDAFLVKWSYWWSV